MVEPVIAIENLNHYYGKGNLKKQVLFDINLSINAGEIVIMTGPSGSGKTTLLSLIGCLRSVQEGNLTLLDRQLNGAKESKLVQMRRQIGYIFQAHNLLGFLSAKQNVQMSIELNDRISKQQAETKSTEMLQAVGLGERVNYYPDSLSGGQKQRLCIARALIAKPQLIFADEPTGNLDQVTAAKVFDLMLELNKKMHTALVIVTHDLEIAKRMNRIFVLHEGALAVKEV